MIRKGGGIMAKAKSGPAADRVRLGAEIRAARGAVSLDRFSARLGISLSTLWRLEGAR